MQIVLKRHLNRLFVIFNVRVRYFIMKEKHVNEYKVFEKIKDDVKKHHIPSSLNWECENCGGKYGNEPSLCGCGCNHFKQIKPEYQNIMG